MLVVHSRRGTTRPKERKSVLSALGPIQAVASSRKRSGSSRVFDLESKEVRGEREPLSILLSVLVLQIGF